MDKHDVIHKTRRTIVLSSEEDWATATSNTCRKFRKVCRFVSKICERTDRHTDALIAILHIPAAGAVNSQETRNKKWKHKIVGLIDVTLVQLSTVEVLAVLVHGQVTIFVVSVGLFVCLCRDFLSRLWSDFDQTWTCVICLGLVVSPRI